jgi:acyl-CoA synthetase (AMP-forming)/AMP-acid ligase II
MIYELLQKWAKVTPNAFAVAAPDRPPLTYGRLLCHVDQTIKALHAMGVGRGDRVATVLPDDPEMAVALLAVASSATSAPLNPSYRSNEFEFYLSDMRAKALIVLSGLESPAVAVAQGRGLPVIRLSSISSADAGVFTLASDTRPTAYAEGCAQPEDVALVLHTSGTTGRPKLVPLTQTNLCVSAENIKMALGLSRGDRCLNVMPLFHVHGLVGALLSTLTAGGSIFCTPGFNASQFFEWMAEFEPTWYTAVPAMHQAVLASLRERKQRISKSSLRFVRSCSSALPPLVMAQLEEAFAVPAVESYGMTETSHQIAINPLPPGERKLGSVGLAAGQQVGIMDDQGHLILPNAVGEVVIRGANVAVAYEQDGTTNPSTIAGGWFRTGDLGFLDSDGHLFLRGRIREMINRGGEKIFPREVEEVILNHAAVKEVVAFAVNDASLGQDVAAAIVLRPDRSATEFEIQEFVASRLADFKVPCRVVFLNVIPKGATGKVQRTGLAEKLGLVDAGLRQPENITPRAIPNSTTERLISEIWRKVLRLERVGMHDNFFFDLVYRPGNTFT